MTTVQLKHAKFAHYTIRDIRAVLKAMRKAKKGQRVKTLKHLGVSATLYYRWRAEYEVRN